MTDKKVRMLEIITGVILCAFIKNPVNKTYIIPGL
jgi:hypothetical protein